MRELDDVDRRIIAVLEERGRTSNRMVSRMLGVSEGTVRTRVKRLQSEGLLRVIAVRSLDPFVLAHLGLRVEAGRLNDVAAAITELNESVFVSTAIGRYDVVAMVLVEERFALAAVRQRIGAMPGVRSVDSTETVDSVKFATNLRKIR